jgi:N-acetylglucosaminyldiphosphoundecaprenol N-acetyl-beta-D-mannosaminyltransferase
LFKHSSIARVNWERKIFQPAGHWSPGCELAARKSYSVFFLGAAPGVADKSAEIMKRRRPGLRVVGTYSPAYSVLESDEQTERSVRAIREGSPDILFVTLGTPKQEKWISRNVEKLSVPVCIGVRARLRQVRTRD